MIIDYEINKIYKDDLGRIDGILAVDKPVGITSHDVVYKVRKKLGTKKVGHAGALDPFASGLLIILVGKATKLSDQFLTEDKEYIADILLGVSTDTGDPEGKAEIRNTDLKKLQVTNYKLQEILKSFQPEYKQYVPVYSSVKVEGNKLRELARKNDTYKIVEKDGEKYIEFIKNGTVKKEVKLPNKVVNIYEIELLELKTVKLKDLGLKIEDQNLDEEFNVAKIRARCSKGTYIRQLAVDVGEKLGVPAMLVGLRRTRSGKLSIDNVYDL